MNIIILLIYKNVKKLIFLIKKLIIIKINIYNNKLKKDYNMKKNKLSCNIIKYIRSKRDYLFNKYLLFKNIILNL